MTVSPAWRVFILCGTLSGAAILPGLWRLGDCDQQIALQFFQQHLREPLFVGLLTVAAFLFSLKTFIIVTMEQNVYSTKEYADKLSELRKLDPNITQYGPLKDFSFLLFLSVLMSLIAAVAQFTLGLLGTPWSAAVCVMVAAWSIAMIFVSLVFMQRNLRAWFTILDGSSK